MAHAFGPDRVVPKAQRFFAASKRAKLEVSKPTQGPRAEAQKLKVCLACIAARVLIDGSSVLFCSAMRVWC